MAAFIKMPIGDFTTDPDALREAAARPFAPARHAYPGLCMPLPARRNRVIGRLTATVFLALG